MEVEAKYALDAALPAERLEAVDLRPYSLERSVTHDLRDVLLDTPTRDIERAGAALRIRQDNGRTLMTLKRAASPASGEAGAGDGDGAIQRREEIELPLAGEGGLAVAEWPELIAEVYRELAGEAWPIVVSELRNLRHTWVVRRSATPPRGWHLRPAPDLEPPGHGG